VEELSLLCIGFCWGALQRFLAGAAVSLVLCLLVSYVSRTGPHFSRTSHALWRGGLACKLEAPAQANHACWHRTLHACTLAQVDCPPCRIFFRIPDLRTLLPPLLALQLSSLWSEDKAIGSTRLERVLANSVRQRNTREEGSV